MKVEVTAETDFLLARQRAKQIAELLGFDLQDQTRIATAVSEVARNAFEYAAGGKTEYYFDRTPTLRLRVVVSDKGKGIQNLDTILAGNYESQSGMGLGLVGAKRLLDEVTVESNRNGTTVTLIKLLRPKVGATLPTDSEIVKQLTLVASQSSQSALRDQNTELMHLLNDLKERETELFHLNQELQETNRGVMVLYSELEDKAESLQQASEMKSRFLSGVTHELRTPLNSIVSLSRLLLSAVDGPLSGEQEKQVNFILRSAQNLTDMVNDLLDLAKIEAGKTTLKYSAVTVAELFAALRGMFRPLQTNENLSLIFAPEKNELTMRTDEGKLAQILRNFISNALKFTDAGSVEVRVEKAEREWITFSVKDTGVGIPSEAKDLVLQEWAQVENPHQAKHKGSGLGLPLSKRLAELLGGKIWFESEVGKGSTFYVSLPAITVEEEHPTPPVETVPERKEEILIIDDDEVARYLVRRRLSEMTNSLIREAPSGQQGLAMIRESRPSLLILDLVMPDITGFQLAHHLQEDPTTKLIPIVIFTSKVLNAAERATLEAFAIEIIEKKQDSNEDIRIQLERALLHCGLSNIHQEKEHP